jgi:hypothetical protein
MQRGELGQHPGEVGRVLGIEAKKVLPQAVDPFKRQTQQFSMLKKLQDAGPTYRASLSSVASR